MSHTFVLGQISDLISEYGSVESAWDSAPAELQKLRTLASSQRGSFCAKTAKNLLAAHGFLIGKATSRGNDCTVDGKPAEIKSSLLWSAGHYKFQQIRKQDFGVLIALGLRPDGSDLFVFSKRRIMDWWKAGTLVRTQHDASQGTDTAWMQVDPSAPFWKQWGGDLDNPDDAQRALENLRYCIDNDLT